MNDSLMMCEKYHFYTKVTHVMRKLGQSLIMLPFAWLAVYAIFYLYF